MPTIAGTGEFTESLMRELHERAERAFVDLATEVSEDIRQRVNVAVGYGTGPRGGRIVIRSKPGEPPRREYGNYRASIAAALDSYSPITTAVFSTSKIGVYLEQGTEKMAARPHWAVTFDDWSDRAVTFIADRIFG